jgi:integrase
MPRKLRVKIDNATSRLKLPARRAPHGLTSIAPGLKLGYRRPKDSKAAGIWVMESYAKGKEWQKRIGAADDFEDADGEHILDFHQAAELARKMVRGTPAGAPATWAQALDAYEADLKTRGGSKYNADQVRNHLGRDAPALLLKPVALLTAGELARWRNDLMVSGLQPASVARILKSARASLNLAASHDDRIHNRNAWRVGLGGVSDDYIPRNQVQPDTVVQKIIAEAYALDAEFGLFVHVCAATGARASQVARLTVANLLADCLMMPSSRKGKTRKVTYHPVPISPGLAERLKRAAKGRPLDAPLLTRDGEAWDLETNHKRAVQDPFAIVAERLGLKKLSGEGWETMYALRHSSIVRAILAGTPPFLVAKNHDTSLAMLEKTYGKYIAAAAGDIARRGLLADADNVVSLAERRA